MSLGNNSQPPAQQPSNQPATPQLSTHGQYFQQSGARLASPLDFINKNLRNGSTQPPQEAPQIITPEPKQEAAQPVQETAQNLGEILDQPEFTLDDGVVEPAQDPADEFPDVEDSQVPENQVSLLDNYKRLKDGFKKKKAEFKEASEKLARLETELTDYREGRKLPDTVQAQEEEISKLRTYQKIVDLKTSPEYQKKYVEPLTHVKNKLEETFAGYNIPKEYVKELKKLTSLADQNEFISEHFDSVGQIQVRQLLDAEKELVSKAKLAEQEPEQELSRLIAEGKQAREVKRKQEKDGVRAELRDGWSRSLSKIKQEGTFLELIPRANDSRYNEGIVKPIIKEAGVEATKFVEMLFEDGLTRLRPEVADFLSETILKSFSSAINATTRQRALDYAKELEENTTRKNAIARPLLGANTGAVPGPAKPRELMTPDRLGSAILGQLGAKK